VALTFVAFRVMVGLGFLFVLLTLVGWLKRRNLEGSPGYLKLMLYAIPLPYIALQAGWIVTEVGRQPWIVYGLMRTKDAVSPIATSQVAISLAAFILVYSALGAIAFYLIAKQARRGPEPLPAAAVQGRES
jgi:cytochrome bd ubiquinol oxidase subunit I